MQDLVRGRKAKRQKTTDTKPVAFVRFKARLGTDKPVVLRALLDSGGSESLAAEEHVQKLRVKTVPSKQVWSTPSGAMTTNKKVKTHFKLPELDDRTVIEWNLHVAKNLGQHDIILGRDILQFLRIDIRFSDQTVDWKLLPS